MSTTTVIQKNRQQEVQQQQQESYKDVHIPLALSPWPYLSTYSIPLTFFLATEWNNSFATLVYVFGVIPFLDLFGGMDEFNPTKAMERKLREDNRYRIIVMMWVPIHFILLIYALHVVVFSQKFQTTLDFILFGLSTGTIGVLGINASHELVHKAGWLEPALGMFCLAMVCNEHFAVEHVIGHHKRVATPEDGASAPLNMSSWWFVLRSLVKGFISAWKLDSKTVGMGILHSVLIFASMMGGLAIPTNLWPLAIQFLLFQGLVACALLEFINYVEHYGLSRVKLENGEYEPVNRFHSWNAANRLTNYLLFKLQRHSDHHAVGGKRYQLLRTYAASPRLPYGYGGMILLSIFTPTYFKAIMNPKAEAAMAFVRECREKGIDPFVLEEEKKED